MLTPLQLSDEEDEKCIEEGSNAIYERQMLPKKHFFFLYLICLPERVSVRTSLNRTDQ